MSEKPTDTFVCYKVIPRHRRTKQPIAQTHMKAATRQQAASSRQQAVRSRVALTQARTAAATLSAPMTRPSRFASSNLCLFLLPAAYCLLPTGFVEVCFTMNLDEMYRLMNLVNPRVGLQNIIPDGQDKHVFAHSTARALSEMYGAVIAYRTSEKGDRLVTGVVPGEHRGGVSPRCGPAGFGVSGSGYLLPRMN